MECDEQGAKQHAVFLTYVYTCEGKGLVLDFSQMFLQQCTTLYLH